MVCKTVKPTNITETDRENVSYPSKCFYFPYTFTCTVEVIYKTLFFKAFSINKTQEKEEKKLFFQNTKKKHVA